MLGTQQRLLHLAHRVARQFGHDEAALGNLEVRELRLELRHDGVGIDDGARLGDHDGHAHFAEVGVRHADDRALGHAGHLVDVALDLRRVDVVAAADDQVLAAADDGDVAAAVDLADVAGFEEAVGGEFFRRLLGHAPVAGEHVRAIDLDAADIVGGAVVALLVAHAQLHARQGETDGAATALALLGLVGVGGEHDRLAHAVALEDRVAGAAPAIRRRSR